MRRQRRQAARLRLELTMRDVLAGMEALVSLDRGDFPSDCFEILGIEPEQDGSRESRRVLDFPQRARPARHA